MAAPRRSRAQWRALLDRQARSGLSVSAFAKREGVHPTTLGWWRWKLGAVACPRPEETPRFVNVDVQPGSVGGYELEFGDQVRLHIPSGFDQQELAALLRALREFC